MNDLHVGPASSRNLDEIRIIEESSFERPYPRFLFEMLLRDCADTFWVATDGTGAVIGYCVASFRGESAHLISLAVTHNHRREGVGSALLRALTSCMEESRVSDVWLEVKVANEAAISFYTKLGFERIEVVPNYYEDGSAALKMKLNLKTTGAKTLGRKGMLQPP